MFFCHQCPFYTYSHHSLYQHICEKHNSYFNNDSINSKNLELIYITRCSDGTFALCMDSSTPSSLPPPPSQQQSQLPPPLLKPVEQITTPPAVVTNTKKPKPRTLKKKATKQKKVEEDNDIVVLSEKRNTNPQPPSAITKHPLPKEKQTSTFVLMKHRRCYSNRFSPCLHSLTLEYNICREHTIRHMCHTYGITQRRRFQPKRNTLRLIDDVAKCLKTVVNDVVTMEDNRFENNFVSQIKVYI